MKYLRANVISKFALVLIAALLVTIDFICLFANSNNNQVSASEQESKKSIEGLHRLDFRLEGKSCAACLLSIQRKINSLPGVKTAVLMLKRPYGVSVIYQIAQIKSDEILSIIKEKEPNIKILELSDTNIDTIPAPLIPPFVPVSEPIK